MTVVALEEESQPWLVTEPTPQVQPAKQVPCDNKDTLLNVVYAPTTYAEKKKSILPQAFASVAAASFHVIVGVGLAFSAIWVPPLEDESGDFKFSTKETSWLASSFVLTSPIGALLAGITMEYMGRLNTIKLAGIPCLIGWVLIATGNSFTWLLMGRLLTGVSAGLGTSPAIVYIAEVADPMYRGSFTSLAPTLASLGMVIIYAQGAYLSWPTCSWINIIYILIPIVIVSIWIPESPVWLVARGDLGKAEKSLEWMAGKNSTLPAQQLAAMVKSQDMKAIVKKSFGNRLKGFLKPTGYKPLLILFGLFTIQQFSGIYITLFFAVTFLKETGSTTDPALVTVLFGLVRFIMSLCNTALLKRFGRRPLCMVSGSGMTVCMIVSGFFTQYKANGGEGYDWLPVTCLLLYVCTSMLGLLSIPWIMTAELFPTEIRGIAHGTVISMGNLLMFLAVQTYRDIQIAFGGAHVVQWFFAAVSTFGVFFVWLFLPETHGAKLSEIEEYFVENTLYIKYKKPEEKQEKTEIVMITEGVRF